MQGNVITRPGGAMVGLKFRRLRVQITAGSNFKRVDAFDIISIVICVHAMKS